MKHFYLRVDDLAKSVAFFSTLFATEPARLEDEFARWIKSSSTSCC